MKLTAVDREKLINQNTIAYELDGLTPGVIIQHNGHRADKKKGFKGILGIVKTIDIEDQSIEAIMFIPPYDNDSNNLEGSELTFKAYFDEFYIIGEGHFKPFNPVN